MSIADEMDMPRRSKTHRAGKGRNRPQKPADHMAQANQHIQNAHKDPTPKGTTAHLFKALGALKKAARQEAPPAVGNAV